MADINAFMLAGTAEEEQNIVMNTAIGLHHKQILLKEIVVSMGDYMNEDDQIRLAKALEFLSHVLSEVETSVLSRQDVGLVVNFFSSRIETPSAPGIKESAIGLRALIGMKGFMKNDAPTISKRLFAMAPQFNMNPAAARLEVYKVLDALMRISRSTLIDMDSGFIKDFLNLSALEKDPRCLMVIFSMIPVLVNEWAITNETTDLWEAISRYFPVTFKMSLNEPFSVTPEDLKLRLRGCMACTSSFAPLAFPYLINKLDEFAKANTKVKKVSAIGNLHQLTIEQRDVMQTITACIRAYQLNVVSTWSLKIWDAVKFEVLNTVEDGLADEALTIVGAITTRLTESSRTLARAPLFRFVMPVVKECVEHFEIPQQQTRQAGQIIGKICASSPFAFHLVIENHLGGLIAMHDSTDVVQRQQALLDFFIEIADAGIHHSTTLGKIEYPFSAVEFSDIEEDEEEPVYHAGLTNFRHQLFDIFYCTTRFMSHEESAILTTAVKGFLKLVQIPVFLHESEITIAIAQITHQAMVQEWHGQLREGAVAALYQIAKIKPEEVRDTAFPIFMDIFPDFTASKEDMESIAAPLFALADISQDVQLFGYFWDDLVHKFAELRVPEIRPEVRKTYSQIILAALLHAVNKREADPQRRLTTVEATKYRRMIEVFYNVFCKIHEKWGNSEQRWRQDEYVALRGMILGSTDERPVEYPNDTSISFLGRITVAALRGLTIDEQQFAATEVFTLFVDIDNSLNKAVMVQKQIDLIIHGTHFHKRTLPLTLYILAGLHREVRLNFNPEAVCSLIIRTFLTSQQNTELAHHSLLGIMALLYNKWCPDTSTPSCDVTRLPVDLIKDIIGNLTTLNGDIPEVLARAVDAIMLFIKSSNLKGDKQTRILLGMVIDQLGHETIGPVLARGFSTILEPSEVLKKENHIVMRPLYQQRPFATFLPRILELSDATFDSRAKKSYLVALSGLLKSTPYEVVLPEIDTILPLLLQELEMPGSDTKFSIINTIELTIIRNPTSVEGHLRGIINRLQDPVHFTKDDPITSSYWRSEVRMKSLTCLSVIPRHLNEAFIIPCKSEVLRGLELAINDDKRHVREEAVRCRSIWFNLAETTEDDE